MGHVTPEEKQRRYKACMEYIDNELDGIFFDKEDMRYSKHYYFMPSADVNKKLCSIPEATLRLMAAQGHKPRPSSFASSQVGSDEEAEEAGEDDEEILIMAKRKAARVPVLAPITPTGIMPSAPPEVEAEAVEEAEPAAPFNMVIRMQAAIEESMTNILQYGQDKLVEVCKHYEDKMEATTKELAAAKRRINELEKECTAFKEIASIIKKARME